MLKINDPVELQLNVVPNGNYDIIIKNEENEKNLGSVIIE